MPNTTDKHDRDATEVCQDCEDREPLPSLSRCLECANDGLPNGFSLPENTREIAEERMK